MRPTAASDTGRMRGSQTQPGATDLRGSGRFIAASSAKAVATCVQLEPEGWLPDRSCCSVAISNKVQQSGLAIALQHKHRGGHVITHLKLDSPVQQRLPRQLQQCPSQSQGTEGSHQTG